VVVECVVQARSEWVASGAYDHLRFPSVVGQKSAVLPDPSLGRVSTWNVEGRVIVRRDLPMVDREIWHDIKDWHGNWHYVSNPRRVYQRDFRPPRNLSLIIERLTEDRLLVRVDEVLDPRSTDFRERVELDLNLLQENVGCAGLAASGRTRDQYLAEVAIPWELLPVGTRAEELVRRIREQVADLPPDRARDLEQRVEAFTGLGGQLIVGLGRFARYFGAKLQDDLVVFENYSYGNAIYLMFEDWGALSQLTRLELLTLQEGQFVRITHSGRWIERLTEEVARRQTH
jgi:hypothetical protein